MYEQYTTSYELIYCIQYYIMMLYSRYDNNDADAFNIRHGGILEPTAL